MYKVTSVTYCYSSLIFVKIQVNRGLRQDVVCFWKELLNVVHSFYNFKLFSLYHQNTTQLKYVEILNVATDSITPCSLFLKSLFNVVKVFVAVILSTQGPMGLDIWLLDCDKVPVVWSHHPWDYNWMCKL